MYFFMRGDYKKELETGSRKVYFNIKLNEEPYKMTESICNEVKGRYGCQPIMNFACVMNPAFRVNLKDLTKSGDDFVLDVLVKCDVADDKYLEDLLMQVNNNEG